MRGPSRLLFLIAALLVPPLHGQLSLPSTSSSQSSASATNQEQNDDPLGRNTPRGTVVGFMRAADKQDYDQAASYLETTQHGEVARQLAQQLQAILDRETSIDLSKLSRKPEGSLASKNPNRELVGVAKSSSGDVEIWLDRVPRGDNPPIWLFSRSTLQQVPDIYEDVAGTSGIEQHIPGWLKITIFSLPLWRIGVILIAIPLILAIGTFSVKLLTKLIDKVASQKLWDTGVHGKGLVGPLRSILFGALCRFNSSYALSLLSRNFWSYLGSVLLVCGVTWMLIRIVAIASKLGVARLRRNRASDQIALANLIGRLSQIGIFIIGVLVILHLAGVNLTAALTGLGIGGLAIAFAAQKTLENLFGGIMIISDRPVRIGDNCKAGDVNGTVVDIGLRSTRIRTQDRTIVTIPNGQLATMNLENITLRDKFWFHPTIMLQQQTTSDQMEAVLHGIRKMLHDHANVESETARVRFISIGNTSLDIEVYAYAFAPDYNGFLAIQESLLLQILAIVESAGTAPAVPIQISRVMNDADSKTSSTRKGA